MARERSAAPRRPPASAARAPPTSPVLPSELVHRILSYAVALDQRTAHRILQLSHRWRTAFEARAFVHVELTTSAALAHFASVVKARPALARYVRRLWIGPTHAASDLLALLALPMPGDDMYMAQQREIVYNDTRLVLRACRRLEDVALSGSLVAADIVQSYGTASQPRRVFSINVHSFVSRFDAPLFRKVEELRVCDIHLTPSEAQSIRRMPQLRHLVLTSPKEYGDAAQDIDILRQVLVHDDLADAFAAWSLDRARLRIGLRTSRARLELIPHGLAACLPPHVVVDLYTEELPPGMADSWEALRDLVFRAYPAGTDNDEIDVDPSAPLQLLHREWQQSASV